MSVTERRQTRLDKVRFGHLLMVAAAAVLLCGNALGQQGTSGSGSASWGSYSWQVTSGTVGTAVGTTTFVGILTITDTGYSGDTILSPIAIPYPTTTTVHEVHGNVAFQISSSSCTGTVIAQVRDQAGNTIAGVYLSGLPQSSTNVPITAALGTALPLSSLQTQTVSQCGPVNVLWSLTMS
jgi:hypothetical protein